MNFKRFRPLALVFMSSVAIYSVAAQGQISRPSATPAVNAEGEPRSIDEWLERLHEAAKKRAYVGTFVVSSGGTMSSAKIWHVCEEGQEMERVDMLSGAPRSTFRHNDQVVTFMPERKVVRHEKRDSLGTFPQFLQANDGRIADFYAVRSGGVERVAGVEADIVTLLPKDTLRFGYRVWTERKRGLVVKLQTLDLEGKVLEQAAFSELQLDAPLRMDKLVETMGKVEGYRVEKPALVKTTASAEGWSVKLPVAGFKPISCYKRPAIPATGGLSVAGDEPLQWIFSDGLASVSVFVESMDKQRQDKESTLSTGATQILVRQVNNHWITVMGEVPMTTLRLFASSIERRK
ncbi:MAG: MucB/RseB C-terminal domain-containing protein [Polaromonas sp.]|nr:MucB/RseB C-terminal domain-containing protein [Polaromonas sp.]